MYETYPVGGILEVLRLPSCSTLVASNALGKVLIVDDEKLVRWSLRQKCEEWGYHVLEADNGSAALRVAHNESPDLVLLDVRLPDANGIEVLEQLRKSNPAPAVIMSISPRTRSWKM